MRHKFSAVESGRDNTCCGCCYCTRRQKVVICSLVWIPILLAVIFLLGVMIRTAFIESPFELEKLGPAEAITYMNLSSAEKLRLADRLGRAIKVRTISYNASYVDEGPLTKLHSQLRSEFDAIFNSNFIEVTEVNGFSLLLRVNGRSETANPYLLCAHLDVVPEGHIEDWDHDPFLGEVINEDGEDFIYGRGSLDDKGSVFAILEALDFLVRGGNQPNRTFYVAFGHDEEIGGNRGAGEIAKVLGEMLAKRNEELAFVLDEGMFVTLDVFPGVSIPIAYVGVVEKGWANIVITARGTQGHSSIPPRDSAVGILSRALARLDETGQPARFGESVEYDTFTYVAPYASFFYKMTLGNLWLFKDLVSMILAGNAKTDTIQRTTTAVTIVRAGFKDNVVPAEAKAWINHRIHPADNIESVVDNLKSIIDDDRVTVEVAESIPPTNVSPYGTDSTHFQIIVNSAFEVFPDAKVTPGTMIAATDTKHYQHLCDAIYRFMPVVLTSEDTDRIHGVNERMSVENYARAVEFYHRLLHNADYDIVVKPKFYKMDGDFSPEIIDNNDEFFEELSSAADDDDYSNERNETSEYQ